MSNILGISALYHDSAATLIQDGKVTAAASEERFTRKKHDNSLPKNAARFCLRQGRVTPGNLDAIVFYEKSGIKPFRTIEITARHYPKALNAYVSGMSNWFSKMFSIDKKLKKLIPGFSGEIVYPYHHQSHAAHTFFTSPFEKSAILTIDGVGEWTTTSIGQGEGNKIKIDKELKFPHSLGLLYSAFTGYLGFEVNEGEYKMMGLAPYGDDNEARRIAETIKNKLIDINEDGSFTLNMDYFPFDRSSTRSTNRKFDRLLGNPPRRKGQEITQFHENIAKGIQLVTEDVMIKLARTAKNLYDTDNLCLSGGVALNCVANSKVLRDSGFERVFVPPGAGDDGGSMGAALFYYHCIKGNKRTFQNQDNLAYLGPSYSREFIEKLIVERNLGKNHRIIRHESEESLLEDIANRLSGEEVIGWFQGRMEFGARALGNRSILADARKEKNWQRVNLMIKKRESFRPFAPVVAFENVREYSDVETEIPYMTMIANVLPNKKAIIPATTHVDGTARFQTVTENNNPLYYNLVKKFEEKTGVPVLINTSFNRAGEPIVCTPYDAIDCFSDTDMDTLVLGEYVIEKTSSGEIAHKISF